jgi:O-antigen/teichoic acid export membrane protein
MSRPQRPSEPESTDPLTGRIRRVAAASTIAQAVGEALSLLQTIVVARLLGPTEVGVFAAGTVITAFLAEFTEGGLRAALVNRGHEVDEAAETVFWGTLVTGTAMSLGALAAAPVIGVVFNNSTAGMVAAVSAGGLLLYSMANVPEALLQREFSVRRRLIVGPAVAASFAAVSITLAALGFGVWSLVAGTYASYLTLLGAVWLLCDWRPRRVRPSLRTWRELAGYGFPLVVGNLAAKLRQLAEAVVVGRLLGTAALGHYRYGLRIARVPVNAMIEIVAYALFPAFSRIASDPDRMRAAYLRALTMVTFCAAPVSGLLLATGEPAAVIVLGEPWRNAGLAVVAMAGLAIGKAFASVSEEAIKGAGRTRLINRFTAAELVLGLGLLALVIPFGLVGVGLAISGTAILIGIQAVLTARSVVGANVSDVMSATLPAVLAGLVAAAAVGSLEHLVVHADTHAVLIGIGLLLLEGIGYVVIYVGLLAVIAPATVREVARAIRRRGTG